MAFPPQLRGVPMQRFQNIVKGFLAEVRHLRRRRGYQNDIEFMATTGRRLCWFINANLGA